MLAGLIYAGASNAVAQAQPPVAPMYREVGDTVWINAPQGTLRVVYHADTVLLMRSPNGAPAPVWSWVIRGDSAAVVGVEDPLGWTGERWDGRPQSVAATTLLRYRLLVRAALAGDAEGMRRLRQP
jgi:hypothetical protein